MFSSAIKGMFYAIIVLFLFCFSGRYMFGQQTDYSFLENTSWLNKAEAGKWEKLLKELPKAEKLLSESNNKYLEIGNIGDNEKLDDTKKQKQISKLENDALTEALESLEKYKSVYLGMTDIIDMKIGDKDREHPAFSAMNNYLNLADLSYNKANETEGTEKNENLTTGNEYELRAIESGIEIFTKTSSSYVASQSEAREAADLSDDIVINADLLKLYQDYKNNNNVPDPLTAHKLMNLPEDDATFNTFEEIWKKYSRGLQGDSQDMIATENVVPYDSLSNDSVPELAEVLLQDIDNETVEIPQFSNSSIGEEKNQEQTTNNDASTDKSAGPLGTNRAEPGNKSGESEQNPTEISNSNADEITKASSKAGVISNKNSTDQKTNTGNINTSKTVTKSNLPQALTASNNDKYEFRVQIAASQAPLSIGQVQAIYKGNMPVVETKEGKYYKYQIKGFDFLSEAQRACSETKVDNAYIEAYQFSERSQLSAAAKASAKRQGITHKTDIEFAVQFAASRVRLTEDQLSEIYHYAQPPRIVFENNWYKYQVYAGNNLENAFGILEALNIKKAFVVAYKNGEKLRLYQAIQEYKSNIP